jgi:hypothetical protein
VFQVVFQLQYQVVYHRLVLHLYLL